MRNHFLPHFDDEDDPIDEPLSAWRGIGVALLVTGVFTGFVLFVLSFFTGKP